jgi:putative FmdB family regulatory protein
MPLYEYECSRCASKFELLVPSPSSPATCPECHCSEVKKLFSRFGFKSGASFTPSTEGKGCGSCSSHNCSSCH